MEWLKNLIARRIGRNIAKKIESTGGNMESKPKWQSKAFVAAVVMVLVNAVEPVSTALGHPIKVPAWVNEILIGMGIYGIRDAKQPLA
jgi:hypothetical protein